LFFAYKIPNSFLFLSFKINGQLQSFRRLQGYLKVHRKAGMYQDVVAGSSQKKVMLMYQQREKFSSLNLLMTSFGKCHLQAK